MCVCVHEGGDNIISLYEVTFDDSRGQWCFNLWYAEASLARCSHICKDRIELLEETTDYFVLLRRNGSLQSTAICRSWRVRNHLGELRLLDPHKDILLMK